MSLNIDRRCLNSAVALAIVITTFATADKAFSTERAMSRDELRTLYEDKTWDWSDGGGYFGKQQRFHARVGKTTKNTTWMAGKWTTNDKGIVCFQGRWKTRGNKRGRYEKTCFEHRTQGTKIFQRRLPKGAWYVFRDEPPKPTDQKLIEGDKTAAR